jgi:hypothetical protein
VLLTPVLLLSGGRRSASIGSSSTTSPALAGQRLRGRSPMRLTSRSVVSPSIGHAHQDDKADTLAAFLPVARRRRLV